MATSTLSWFADRGFELTTEITRDEVVLRLDCVPVPADGTTELRRGVELHRLDVLFKASVMIEGEPGQIRDATVKLTRMGKKATKTKPATPGLLKLDARCEDVETGEIVPFKVDLEIELPADAPKSGGPRPVPLDEDELDWDDENTLESLGVGGPELQPPAKEEEDPKGSRGLQALLDALASLGDEDPGPEEENGQLPPPEAPDAPLPTEPERSAGDQSMGAADEARGLLELLVRGENLELEEDASVEALVSGTVEVLALQVGPEAKATRLSTWLLDQDSVADLFIGDEDLAAILEQW